MHMKQLYSFLNAVLFIAVLNVASAHAQIDPLAGKKFRVLVFGDSITYGNSEQAEDSFSSKLQRKIRTSGYDSIEVLNLSKAGETSSGAVARTGELENKFADVIIIQLGYQDIRRGIAPPQIFANLGAVVQKAKATNAYVVVAGISAPESRGKAYQEAISQGFYNLATSNAVALYPDILEYVAHSSQLTLADGIQPNSLGVDIIVEQMFPLIESGLRWAYETHQYKLQTQDNQLGQPVLPPAFNAP